MTREVLGMHARRSVTLMVFSIVVAIGCGRSPGASATDDTAAAPTPIQLAQAPDSAAPAAAGGAAVTGSVKLSGTPPAAQAVKMSADPVCQQQHQSPVMSEEVVVGPQGGLKNVFVSVKGAPPSASAPATPVTLDQTGCWYTPHVFGIQVNQPLEIINSDATLHNVNAKPLANPPFNVAQPVKGMKTSKKFTKPEIGVKFKCNVHPWMSAFAGVVDHPYYAVSKDDGTFAISGLPDGTYTLEAWHEKYGTQTAPLTVSGGAAPPVQFTFAAQ